LEAAEGGGTEHVAGCGSLADSVEKSVVALRELL